MVYKEKYVGRFDIKIADKSKPIEDITQMMMTIKTFEARLNNLQKKDPSKPLEEIYRSNLNALNLIERLKQGIKDSKVLKNKQPYQLFLL